MKKEKRKSVGREEGSAIEEEKMKVAVVMILKLYLRNIESLSCLYEYKCKKYIKTNIQKKTHSYSGKIKNADPSLPLALQDSPQSSCTLCCS